MELLYTKATLKEIEHFFRTSKKLNKKLVIIETSCHTLIERQQRLFRPGYQLVITDKGALREVDVRGMTKKGMFSLKKSKKSITQVIFEYFYAFENQE